MPLIGSPLFSDHLTPPGHPERTERAKVFESVSQAYVQNGGRVIEPRPATREELLRIHDAAHVDSIEETAGRSAMLDPDTFVSPGSAAVARLAAGAAVRAAEHAIDSGELAFALVRPPGHHAERDRAMGFCLYNNAAVAAAALRARGVRRVAIVDIDVHHGNGTQNSFYTDPDVLYISTHQFPFYPGTGAAAEIGAGRGAGFTVNIPLEAGATDADFFAVHDTIVLPVLNAFRPELTIVSAGFDAHEADPLASMRMTAEGYERLFAGLASVGRQHGAVCAVTEGGYDLPALSACLEACLKELEAGPKGSAHTLPTYREGTPSTNTARAERAIAAVRAAHKSFWRQL